MIEKINICNKLTYNPKTLIKQMLRKSPGVMSQLQFLKTLIFPRAF